MGLADLLLEQTVAEFAACHQFYFNEGGSFNSASPQQAAS
jgi:hypothetical protein